MSNDATQRPPLPSVGSAPMPTMSPADAARYIGGRQIDLSNIYVPAAAKGKFAPAEVATNMVEGPASIVELARALKNDPDLIFQWVYNNVDYHPTYGEAKGALGCLLDNNGNSWDQCELLVALLTQAGFTPHYVLGQIQITAAQAAAWLGTDPSNINYAFNILNEGGIPVQLVNSNTELLISHIWVGGVVISGTSYVFDPSFKLYTTTAAINLATAMGYTQSAFKTQAEIGATVDPSGNFVENLNKTNIRSEMQTFATNLQNYIKTNNPTARVSDIVGGRAINQISAPVRLTALPYEAPGDVPTTFTTVPNNYRIVVGVQYVPLNEQGERGTGFTTSFFGSDVHAQRLSMFYNNTTGNYELKLNGTTVVTSNGNVISGVVNLSVTHPYATTFANQTGTQAISGPFGPPLDQQFSYVFGCSFGPIGQGTVDYFNKQALAAQAAGDTQVSEPLLGNQLALMYYTREAQAAAALNLIGNFASSTMNWHHEIGTAYWTTGTTSSNGAAGFNIVLLVQSIEALNAAGTPFSVAPALGLLNSSLEDLTIQQSNAGAALSTPLVLQTANGAGTKIYKITPANQSTLLPLLSGYQSDAQTAYTAALTGGTTIFIPQTPAASSAGWGLLNGASIGGAIFDVVLSKGGVNSGFINPVWNVKPTPKYSKDSTAKDPVNTRTGDFLYESSDISVGSQGFPYELEFKSMYDSRLKLVNPTGMGLGWKHNHLATANVTSDFLHAMGSQSPIEAAMTIAELYITADLLADTTYPVDKMVISFMIGDWWIDQLTNNAVTVSLPDGDYTYVLLADGTYSSQINDTNTLTVSFISGFIHLTSPQQDVRSFPASTTNLNLIRSWTFPNGVILNYTVSGTTIRTVTNNMGRTLTLNYTGAFLTSVTDGNGRSSQYSVNSTTNLLTSITDPMSFATTFSYDSSNRFVSYFRPQNPTNAYVTNSYDSLDRISSQLDIYGNQTTFYLAGSRSELKDPAGNSYVQYYDSGNNLIELIDELGNITTSPRDGRGRVTLLTYPEGNSEAYTYDSFNNVLSVTYKAKPGSSLANIVNRFTYDPTYNKVHTAVDGKSQTTTCNYDPATGNLLTIKKPAVSGVTPTVTMAYNARGQVTSTIDETGIQTQTNYDTTTEELLSVVVNTNWRATVGGTITVGDILTITAHDALLTGGQEAVSYTVQTGDTTTKIAAGLTAAINADANLAAVDIVAYSTGAVVSVSTATGNNTTFTESTNTGATETIALAAGLKLTTTYGYDTAGNANSVQDPLLNTTTFLFDNSRRLTTRTEATPFSYVTMYGYDKNNNLTSFQRQTGIVMTPFQTYTIAYTLSDKIFTVTDPATNATTKTYDTFDRLWTVTDAQMRKTTFLYDARSKLFTVTDPSNTICETRTYTNNGKLYQLTDARSKTTTYSYDGFDRADKITYADTSFEENVTYDANNNVLSQRTRSAATITNTYDVLNRLSTKLPSGQAKVTYSYDLSGRVLSVTTPVVSGNPATGAFSFSYDSAGRLKEEKTPDALTVLYGLDKNGNVTKLTYPDAYYVTRVYDQLNRLTDVKLNGATTSAIHITYDELSRRNVLTYGNGATTTYTFQLNDDLTGLAEAFTGSSVTYTYGFNKVHQETSRSVTDGTYLWHPGAGGTTSYGTANSVNEYPTVGGTTYSYDGNGNFKSDGTWTYVYDTENHLLSANMTGVSASYVYDGLHRQVQKAVGSADTRFYYAGWQRLADYDGVAKTLLTRYIYGMSLDEALIAISSTGSITYLHSDRLGSIIATSNSTGNVTGKAAYGPYGESLPPSGFNVGYAGQRYDSETNLYYMKNRQYKSSDGRFLQPDLAGYAQGVLTVRPLHLYTYVSADPLNFVDPIGRIQEGDPTGGWVEPGGTGISIYHWTPAPQIITDGRLPIHGPILVPRPKKVIPTPVKKPTPTTAKVCPPGKLPFSDVIGTPTSDMGNPVPPTPLEKFLKTLSDFQDWADQLRFDRLIPWLSKEGSHL